MGVLWALPSGTGVAVALLQGSSGPLIGVAISASLLPPVVNCVSEKTKQIKLIKPSDVKFHELYVQSLPMIDRNKFRTNYITSTNKSTCYRQSPFKVVNE